MRRLVAVLTSLGAAYGPDAAQVIAEEQFNNHRIQVLLHHDDERWAVIVRSAPPLDAVVSLHAEGRALQQSFDAAGETRFSDVREAWLTQGFDVVLIVALPVEP